MKNYTPLDWYWIDEAGGRVYSSARQAIVTPSDAGFLAFTADGTRPTAWPCDAAGAVSDAAFSDVLKDIGARYGVSLILPSPSGLSLYAAAKRWAAETAGIVINGASIATDRVSQAMIGNAYAYVQASGVASVSYKTTAGFVTLSADQVKAVALAVGAHVQACFDAEAAVDAGITSKPPKITTTAQIDAAFAGLMPAAAAA